MSEAEGLDTTIGEGVAPGERTSQRRRKRARPERSAASDAVPGPLLATLEELAAIRAEMLNDTERSQAVLAAVHELNRDSTANLLNYLTLRRRDVRGLQSRLSALGLSSLGRSESYVLATIDAVLDALHRLAGRVPPVYGKAAVDFTRGQELLSAHTETLLGPATASRAVRIMVTMPSEAAHDYSLVHDLLRQGMNCMRINCAHDDAATWSAMIDNLRRAERALGQSCRVVMDLAGPKLRTGPLEPGPAVVRVRPKRDVFGHVTAPARVWLTRQGAPCAPPTEADASLPLPDAWVAALHLGERINLVDVRGARRSLVVVDVTPDGCWAKMNKTAYVVPGTMLQCAVDDAEELQTEAAVGELPTHETALELNAGDMLTITRDLAPGRPATYDSNRRVLTPARIGCTLPEVFDHARFGEPIWFDDGKIGGVIDRVERDRVLVRITQTRADGATLRADKGINLPETDIRIAAMTEQDLADLPFIARHADIVALSFANTARDVEQLQEHLRRFADRLPAIVIKIETRRGFENLPDMLLTAMRWPSCGVMIARGDLAVECGFERLAEVQEEILWICEAAHVPVIWATQVLETLAKRGMASRAEITDAAMGHRAECVMLNKGPHVGQAVRVLDDILRRMQAHQVKKRSMLRQLRLARTTPRDGSSGSQNK